MLENITRQQVISLYNRKWDFISRGNLVVIHILYYPEIGILPVISHSHDWGISLNHVMIDV